MIIKTRRVDENLLRTWFYIKDHLHCLFPEGNHGAETGEVEVIFNKVLGYLAEVFVARERAEPGDPSEGRCGCRGR